MTEHVLLDRARGDFADLRRVEGNGPDTKHGATDPKETGTR
jgi:hypothetical protein